MSTFTKNVYCDLMDFGRFQLLRHVGANKHHLFLDILTKVVPGADMDAGRYDCVSAREPSI